MAHGTSAEVSAEWATRLGQSAEKVKAGVARVTENPMAKAAANEDKWFAGVQRAKSEGRFKRGLMKTSLEDWQRSIIEKGADRIAAGAAQAVPKMTAFFDKALPYMDNLKKEIDKMPSTTLEDNIARSAAWQRKMAQFDNTK